MNTATSQMVAGLKLGEPQVYRNIAVFPLFAHVNGAPRYLALGEALSVHLVTVTEISESGSVPKLKVINRGNIPVLLLDGEELIGAKQNRVLNTSILLKELSETVVPVSCTEQGRWNSQSATFADSGVVMAHKLRAQKTRSVSESLDAGAQFQSDQGGVWDGIAELHANAKSSSPTGAMHDVFAARAKDIDQCLKAFVPVSEQNGLLTLINGEVAGFDIVTHPEIYRQLHPRLVKSYVVEALVLDEPAGTQPQAPAARATAFVQEVAAAAEKPFPSVGHGTDYRFQAPRVAGTALVHEDRVVHAAFFRLPGQAGQTPNMASLRRRRGRFME